MDKKGFTLIELLVVVLIIGLLAAMALPRYFKAVEEARTTEVLTALRSISQAQEYYFLRTGHYANSSGSLAVSVPASKYYDINIVPTPTYNITAVHKQKGKDGDVPHFQYFMQNPPTKYMGAVLCLVPKGNDSAISICEYLGGILVPDYGDATYDAYIINVVTH